MTAQFDQLLPALCSWMPAQRWYAGAAEPKKLTIVDSEVLLDGSDGSPGMASLVVEADGVLWHLPVGWRSANDLPPAIAGRDGAVIGELDQENVAYDAAPDFELGAYLFQMVTGKAEAPSHIRPVGAEQSNTSLVGDDEVVVKIFRRVEPGPNPDVTVPSALTEAGFDHVPPVLGVWRRGEFDLAVAVAYLHGASDGFALALASLRDCLRSRSLPEESGADFAAEASRLGQVTAELHVALSASFGTEVASPAQWAVDLGTELNRANISAPGVEDLLGRLKSVADAGCLIQGHGDYHLGQVLRTDSGWYVLDFEGEPDRRAEERERRATPLRDLAGMLRSFGYAAAIGLGEQAETDRETLVPLAEAWVARNRDALQSGYTAVAGIEKLLPAPADRPVVLTAFELEKAVYELGYERAHRPDWVHIPEAAISRLLPARVDPATGG
jgi:maltokinase